MSSSDDIRALKDRYLRAQREAASAETQVRQAEAALAQAEKALVDLGFDPKKPLDPQVASLVKKAETTLAGVEETLANARAVLD